MTFGERIFSLLLLAYPASFRRRYRVDLLAFFRADRDDPTYGDGPTRGFRFWFSTIRDLARAGFIERVAALGRFFQFEPSPYRSTTQTTRQRREGFFMDTLTQDLRYTARTLLRSPGFAFVAVATLALGIGTNAAMFSIVNGVLLQELPYEDADRIVMIYGTDTDGQFHVSENERLRYRGQTEIFEAFGTFQFQWANLTGSDGAERVVGALVDLEVFTALGVNPIIGRGFRPEEAERGNNNVALLSHEMWMSRFGGRADVVGETFVMSGRTVTVTGVLPQGFRLPGDFVGQPVQLYRPQTFSPEPDPQNIHYLTGLAKLQDGVSLAQARERLAALSPIVLEELPTLPPTFAIGSTPIREEVLGEIEPILFILLGSVALVLLIACVNVANLFLARADGRTSEMSIRAALGAGRGRIVRQLITESLVLAAIGGGVGLLIAFAASDAVVRFNPPNIPRVDQIGVTLPVIAFTAGISILTALLFGLAPALSASRQDLRGAMHDAAKSTTVGTRRHNVRRLLVVSEMALAIMLTIGAGLLVRSFMRLQGVEPGFNPTQVLTAQTTLPFANYRNSQAARAFYQDLLQRVRSTPSVVNAGAITQLPLASDPGDWGIRIEGREEELLPSGRHPWADRMVVTVGYFETLGIPLVDGRTYTAADDIAAPQVVIINEETARRYWPNESAVGKRFVLSANIDTVYRTVVGVVQDVRHGGLSAELRPEMYLPHAQHPATQNFPIGTMNLVVRTAGDPAMLTSAVRQAVRTIDQGVPLSRVRTMDDVVAASTSTERLNVVLFAIFGLLGLSLVSVGVYGVMSYFISQRTKELGIRIALGAAPQSVLRLVVGHGLMLALVGAVIGIGGALTLGRLMSSLLFGVSWNDPTTFIAIPALVTGVAVMACLVPARRATRVDPISVLRAE